MPLQEHINCVQSEHESQTSQKQLICVVLLSSTKFHGSDVCLYMPIHRRQVHVCISQVCDLARLIHQS